MPSTRFLAYLDDQDVEYEILHHRIDYTAQETAADTHTPGREFAKTVVLDTPNGPALAVVPAVHKVDLEKVRQGAGVHQVGLADEAAMGKLCPDCEVGAMPPFGHLYEMPVYVDPLLARGDYITFNAGTHDDAVRMRYSDFERLVHPTIMEVVAV